VSELDFHFIGVERAFLVEQGRRGRAEAMPGWSLPRPVSQAKIRSALFSGLSDIGTSSSMDVRQIADQCRGAIRAFGVSLTPS
jgi:hypothetical protein